MAYATMQDLTDRFPRPLTAAETAQAPVMLDDASFWLNVWIPGLQQAVDSGDVTLTTAAMLTTVQMVSRCLQARAAQQTANPAAEQITEAWGPYSQSVKYRSSGGNLYLYDSEKEYLEGLISGDMSEAVSMRSMGL